MKAVLMLAAMLATSCLLPAQVGTQRMTATVLSWQVRPDPSNASGGTLWCYNHVTGEFSSYALDIPNGWGNLPSMVVRSTFYQGGSSVQGEDPPASKIVTRWVDKDGFDREVVTVVSGGDSPENHARALKQHEKDVAALAKKHPPKPQPEN